MVSKKDPKSLLREILQSQEVPNTILIISPDRVRRDKIFSLLIDKLNKNPAKVESKRFDAERSDKKGIGELQTASASLSLFSKNQLFIIDRLEELPTEMNQEFLSVIGAASSQVRFILSALRLDTRSVLRKPFDNKTNLIEFEELKGFELNRWIIKELSGSGITKIDEEAINALAQLGAEDPDKIAGLIEHASLYVEGDTLLERDLSALFPEKIDAQEFDFVDAVVQRRAVQAERLLSGILRNGKNPIMLLGLLTRTVIQCLSIRYLLDRGLSAPEIKSRLKLSPYVYNKVLTNLKGYSVDRLSHVIRVILKCDSLLKNRAVGPENIFARLLASRQ